MNAGIRTLLLTVAAVVVGGGARLLACPSCFGAEETTMIDGTKLGIVAMLAVTFGVQGAFLGFFMYLRKRAKSAADVELDVEWLELQRGSRKS
jgi:heme/copper-type cytochrome/quinol oxidase subunit 2